MKYIIISASILLVTSLMHATVLSDLADTLTPGTWAILNEAGDGSGFTFDMLNDAGGHNILQYTEDAKWDSVRKRFMYLGQGHSSNWDNNSSTNHKFIVYDDASDTWDYLPDIPGRENIGHAYDHSAIDPSTGDFYHRPYSSTTVYKFTAATQAWSTSSNFPSNWVMYIDMSCCMGLEFFPERNGLILSGKGNVHFYDFSQGSWETKATGLAMTTQYQSFCEYNPVHKLMVFGGGNGSSDIHEMDSQGNISPLNQAPIGVGVMQTVFTCDPVSGKYLVIHKSGSFYEYDVISDSWQNLPGRADPLFDNIYGSSFSTVAAPVNTYGVIMFLAWNFQNSKVLIYKHTAGTTGVTGKNTIKQGRDLIKVSPNPFTSVINIAVSYQSCPGGTVSKNNLEIFNVTGKLVEKLTVPPGRDRQLKTGITWNPSNQPPGIYLLKVQIDNQQYSKKLILQK